MMKFQFGSETFPGLLKVMEEAGESVQAITKLMGSQTWTKNWPKKRHIKDVREELADLQATLNFVFWKNPELYDHERREEKLAKFKKWHEEQVESE